MTVALKEARVYEPAAIAQRLEEIVATYPLTGRERRDMLVGAAELLTVLDRLPGDTLQNRWRALEDSVWPKWVKGNERPSHWNYAVRIFVVARLVRPGWPLLARVRASQWFERVHPEDPFARELAALRAGIWKVSWVADRALSDAYGLGTKLLLVNGYSHLSEIKEQDLKDVPRFVGHGLMSWTRPCVGSGSSTERRSAARLGTNARSARRYESW